MSKGSLVVFLAAAMTSACMLKAGASSGASTSSGTSSPSSGSSDSAPTRSGPSTVVDVPDVVGKTKAEAEAIVAGAGIRGGIRIDNDPGSVDLATATVCTQVPGAGNKTSSNLFIGVRFCFEQKSSQKLAPELAGLTIADATALARETGFTGQVKTLEMYEHDASCKAGTVCRVSPAVWHWNQDHVLTLYINRNVSISTPPSE